MILLLFYAMLVPLSIHITILWDDKVFKYHHLFLIFYAFSPRAYNMCDTFRGRGVRISVHVL